MGVGARYRSAAPDAPRRRHSTHGRRNSANAGSVGYERAGCQTTRVVAYRIYVSPAASNATSSSRSAILTWRAHDGSRMESVRVQLSGKRIKANGRIVAAATDTHP